MSNSFPFCPRRLKSTLNLSVSSSNVAIPVHEALEEPTLYDNVLCALRDAHTRKRLSVAIELADMMDKALKVLKDIRAKLDKTVPWSPSTYDRKKLMNPGSDLSDPDCFFSRHATRRARVLFRITAKEFYTKAKHLDERDLLKLCSLFDCEDFFDPENCDTEIVRWIERFETLLEVGKTNEPGIQVPTKRKQADANLASERTPMWASSNPTIPPAMRPPSVPYRINGAQVAAPTNQSIPAYQSPYQNQPQQQTVQKDTCRMDSLAHSTASPYQGGLVTLIPEQMYYRKQQSSQDSALRLQEVHRQLPPQGHEGQEQGEQQGPQSMATAGLDGFITDEMGNDIYPEFLFQYYPAY